MLQRESEYRNEMKIQRKREEDLYAFKKEMVSKMQSMLNAKTAERLTKRLDQIY